MMESPKKLSVRAPAPTVGVLVDWLEDGYQWTVLRGAIDAARDRGAHLLCFTGGMLGAPHRGSARRNGVFDLVSRDTVDALVIFAGSVGNFVGPEKLREYCERFQPLPMCSIAIDLEGMSSVCVDNEAGVQKAVAHLARVHGLKRIAFVRGPASNVEAERRFRAYREALASCGLPIDPDLVVIGDFQPEGGRRAVRWFHERRIAVEAIIAANDAMALGALDELDAMGIRVPEQMALVGFDDLDEVRFTIPPLTTVRQPLYEQGRDAVKLLLDQLRFGTSTEKLVRPTELVLRRSCRCFGASSDGLASASPPSRLSFEAALVDRRQLILAHVTRAARGSFSAAGAGWETRLVGAFASQMRGDSPTAFIEGYDDLLRRLSKTGVEIAICNDVLSVLRRQMVACLGGDHARLAEAEDLFQEARVLTSQAMERAQALNRMAAERRVRWLGRAGSTMSAASSIDDLTRAVAETLPNLGIERCYVSLFEGTSNDERRSRLILAHDPRRDEASSPPDLTAPYRTADILPRGALAGMREHAFTVAPLFFGDVDLGIVLLELGAVDGSLYESLRELVSSALWSARQADVMDAESARSEALEAQLVESRRRTDALEQVRAAVAAAIERRDALEAAGADANAVAAELTPLREELARLLAVTLEAKRPSSAPPRGTMLPEPGPSRSSLLPEPSFSRTSVPPRGSSLPPTPPPPQTASSLPPQTTPPQTTPSPTAVSIAVPPLTRSVPRP